MYIAIIDFDKTLTLNDGTLLNETITDINKYTINNKLCILSEATYNELADVINKYNINCDFFSTSSAKGIINNKIVFAPLNKDDLNLVLNEFKDYLYTAYFEYENNSYIINYQDRLDLVYPKNNRKIINEIPFDISSITIAMNVGILDEFYNKLDLLNLNYTILAKDKNRNLIKLSNINYSKKENLIPVLKNIYPNSKTIGISDSLADYNFVTSCDISIAMKKSELESKINLSTDKDNSLNGCMDMLFKIK